MDKTQALTRQLPDDIVEEIFKHCRGLSWSYRDLARLCLVNRTWSYYGKRTLYQDLRLDYRHEVEDLALSLQRSPHNAQLVKSLVINGDGAHAAFIHKLLAQVKNSVKHIHFFDFELPSILVQQALCLAIVPSPPEQQHQQQEPSSLNSLAFAVLPVDFVLRALSTCCKTIVSLRMYRVDLSSSLVDNILLEQQGSGELCFPALRYLSLSYIGNLSPSLFKAFITVPSSKLRTLKIRYDRLHDICQETSLNLWEECQFHCLNTLELGSFQASVVASILKNNRSDFSALQTIRLYSLRQLPSTPLPSSTEAVADNPSSYDDIGIVQEDETHLLDCLPQSLRILDLKDCRNGQICKLLPSKLYNGDGDGLDCNDAPLWLPQLVMTPTITVGAHAVPRSLVPTLKEQYIEAARKRNLRLSDDSLCYAVEGFWD